MIHGKYYWHLDFENNLISFKQCWMKVFLLLTGHNADHSTNLLKSVDSSKRREFFPSWMICWCSYQLTYNNFIFLSSLFPVDGVLIQLDTLNILNYNSRLSVWIEHTHFCSNKKNKIWCICNCINTYLPTKVHLVKTMVFPVVMYGCESWTIKKAEHRRTWSFWTVVLEKTLESPLDRKEIQPVHLKVTQSWIFIGRTDVEVETPRFWPRDSKNWLICKDPDAGKDWRWEE